EQGVDLARTMVLPPGLRPTATVPDGLWPDRARSHDPGRDDTTADGRSTEGQSTDGPTSPARKRKKKPRPQSTSYGQERQRGR
ncbi:hypothetical protein, partial [Streptomyces albogriseolus]